MEYMKPGYTRVSEILSIYQAYAHVPREKLKKAQEVGTLIHEAIENYFKGMFDPLPKFTTPYFESFLKWARVCDIEPIIIEKRFYDDSLMITGRIDLFARIGSKIALIDFKTGSWAHPEIWRLQGAFYRHLISSECWPKKTNKEVISPPDDFIFVQLSKQGEDPTLHTYTYDPSDWEMCKRSIES